MKGLLVMNTFGQSEGFLALQHSLLTAAAQKKIQLDLYTNSQLLFDVTTNTPLRPLAAYDFCLFWDKDTVLGKQLEYRGLRLFNPVEGIAAADNKLLTHMALSRAGLPQPATVQAPLTFAGLGYTRLDFLEQAEAYLGYPMVIKECRGSFGWQVYLAQDRKAAVQILVEHAPSPMLLQAYVGGPEGADVRIYVVGGRVIGAIRRHNPHDFRANVASGGIAEAYAPTPGEAQLAIQAAAALGLDFAGVDLLPGPDGPLICEVNSNAQFHGLAAKTGVDVAGAIFSHIRQSIGQYTV